MTIGRVVLAALVLLIAAACFYTSFWHLFPLFIWQHPMLSWLPFLALIAVGFAAGTARSLVAAGARDSEAPPTTISATGELVVEQQASPAASDKPPKASSAPRPAFAAGPGIVAGIVVLLIGLFYTLISPPAVGLDDIDYELVDRLPKRTQPRLLPRTGVADDPRFADSKEVHLTRDPATGDLLWTGEWQAATFGGASSGVTVKRLDDLLSESQIVRGGFERSVAGITPGTLKARARLSHPFSRIQYPVLIPTGDREAIAIAPYVGYRGFPFRTPYLRGVLVYHEDGTLEDLTPEEAAARPEIARSGRIVPETVARKQAEALARSDEIDGKIVDGEGNKQPFLTAIDRNRTVWLTIINDKERDGGVKAIVLADSTTGQTQVWRAGPDDPLISTKDVIDEARALPLRWKETRCCDSDGHSYTVTLREVVEPRLAFKDGRPYYLVTVVPTDELPLGREVEYTLLIDARTGKKLDQFDHVNGGRAEDARLQRFFG